MITSCSNSYAEFSCASLLLRWELSLQGSKFSREWGRIESPWYNLFNEIYVEPFTREQAIELLVEPVRDYYTYEPEALEFIIDQCDGRPFRIQQYGLETVSQMLAHNRRRIKLKNAELAHQKI